MISRVWSSCLKSRKEEERVHEEDKRTKSNEYSQLRNGTKANKRSNPERSKQHSKQPSINMAWCTTKDDACPVYISMAWKGAQTTLQIKWSSICNELHIDKTPHDLFSSLSVMYPTILNVDKHGKRVKEMKTTYLGKFKWGRNNKQQVRKNPHMHIMNLVLFYPEPYFRVVKHARWVHHVKLGIFYPIYI